MRIGLWDIESSSLDAEYGQLLCAVIGEYRSEAPLAPQLKVYTLADYENCRWDDRSLACNMRDDLEQFDLVLTYNGARFDLPFLNTRLIETGERGARLRRHKDLLYVMRHKF